MFTVQLGTGKLSEDEIDKPEKFSSKKLMEYEP
jgi:hypothetical protein